jgi:hypothetical protein
MTNTLAALQTVVAVGDAIRSLKTVPSGVLYAHLMGHLTLDQYHAIIAALVDAGVVIEQNHLLTWKEPA